MNLVHGKPYLFTGSDESRYCFLFDRYGTDHEQRVFVGQLYFINRNNVLKLILSHDSVPFMYVTAEGEFVEIHEEDVPRLTIRAIFEYQYSHAFFSQ